VEVAARYLETRVYYHRSNPNHNSTTAMKDDCLNKVPGGQDSTSQLKTEQRDSKGVDQPRLSDSEHPIVVALLPFGELPLTEPPTG